MNATHKSAAKTVPSRALPMSEWWPAFNRLLVAEHLDEATFAVARPYFKEGYSPEEAFKREFAIQARMIAA